MKYYSIKEAAAILEIDETSVAALIKRKTILAIEDPLHRNRKYVSDRQIEMYKKKKYARINGFYSSEADLKRAKRKVVKNDSI